MSNVNEDEVLLLDNQKNKKTFNFNFHIFKNGSIIIYLIVSVIGVILFIVAKSINKQSLNESNDDLPFGFEFLDKNADHGPITVNREKDDGTKLNMYDYIHPEDLSFYYNQEEFDKLEDIINEKNSNYFCEYGTAKPPEAYEGYEIKCPTHYTIKLDYVFYGRHANDTKHCNKYYEGVDVEEERLKSDKECGSEPIEAVKELCEGRVYCSLRPGGSHFTDSCSSKFKYLHIDYHCVKDKVKIKLK
ncbi:hypothetical protein LY90DRAFT_501718 [Neocallimastix californiae]|uniref:SUEL-type lectin domain-containing protein n=1 Tax=Neocallimastix californiae TaxID=1754190 RepID=A0A1Y2EYR2_9FUNG|nr:hypothetical protein LY90DRAFT_501718 [Neocallimastix californiae]|eukprot:ORY76404.1 hypothetical protein LY90DRAFT_501718 [Neocallimastix californiae]